MCAKVEPVGNLSKRMGLPKALRGYRALIAAGAIDVGVTAFAFAIRDVPTGQAVRALIFGTLVVAALLILGAIKWPAMLYVYPIYAAFGIVTQLATRIEVSSMVVVLGLAISATLVILFLRSLEPQGRSAGRGRRRVR